MMLLVFKSYKIALFLLDIHMIPLYQVSWDSMLINLENFLEKLVNAAFCTIVLTTKHS